MLKLSSEGLQNILQLEKQEDFTFKTNKREYKVSTLLACFISPIITQNLKQDLTIREFKLDVEEKDGNFDDLIDLMTGKEIKINDSNFQFLLDCSNQLGNEEILEKILDWKFNKVEITTDNAVERMMLISQLKVKHKPTIEFIRDHFTEIPYYYFKKCNLDTLIEICSIEGLHINNESQLFAFVNQIVNDLGPEYFDLFGCVLFEYLPPEDMETFVNQMCAERMTGKIWESLSKRLCMKVFPDWKKEERHTFAGANDDTVAKASEKIYFNGDNHWDGILARLWRLCGSVNPHDAGKARVFVSSTYNGCKQQNVINMNWDNYWYSCNEDSAWFCIDFMENLVVPHSYELRSGSSGLSLRSWVMEGSKDAIKWDIIDEHNDSNDFKTKFSSHYYEITNENEYRYIRIRQTSKNNHGAANLELSRIEIYGNLILFD